MHEFQPLHFFAYKMLAITRKVRYNTKHTPLFAQESSDQAIQTLAGGVSY